MTEKAGTFRRFVVDTTVNFAWARAYWGMRLLGTVAGLMADAMTETAQQMFYSRLPGHPHQAPDSLAQVGSDRDLFKFRGESNVAFAARVLGTWEDHEQAGTTIQLLKVINQWGSAGFPVTWDEGLITCVESGDPADWSFVLTIGFGAISPAWVPWSFGDGSVFGDFGLFFGVGPSTDIPTLLYLVKKWKRAASIGDVRVYYTVSDYVTFVVR